MSRVIRGWAKIYDLVNSVIFLLFGGTRKLHKDVISMMSLKGAENVLDIGCGTGEFMAELVKRHMGIRLCGVDASDEMIAVAAKKAKKSGLDNLEFKVAWAQKLPYQNQEFDCAVSIFLFHHLPMQVKMESLREIARVLKPQGEFMLVDVDMPTTLTGRLIGMTRLNVMEIRENMQQPLTDLLKSVGFSSPEVIRKDYGIFSFIKCSKIR